MAKLIKRDWHGRFVKGTAKVPNSGTGPTKIVTGRGFLRKALVSKHDCTLEVIPASLAPQEEFRASLEGTFAECLAISAKKNADYASDADPFKNFRTCEALGVPLGKGIVVRMSDKLTRIANLLEREAQVKDESIHDTICDLINYAAILRAYLTLGDNKKTPCKTSSSTLPTISW